MDGNMDEKMSQAEVEQREDQQSTTTRTPPDQDETAVPKGYWYSYRFIGSVVAIVLLANNLFIGYSMPVSFSRAFDRLRAYSEVDEDTTDRASIGQCPQRH